MGASVARFPNPKFRREGDSSPEQARIREYLLAAALHQEHVVRSYIEDYAMHPDATMGGKPTALCYSLMKPNIKLAKYLLEQGADHQSVDALGMTPLHYAAMGGCPACVFALLRRGAARAALNCKGETPVDLAASVAPKGPSHLLLFEYGRPALPQ